MIDSLRLIHATGDQRICGQSQSNVVKTREELGEPMSHFSIEFGVLQKWLVVKQAWVMWSTLLLAEAENGPTLGIQAGH